MIGTIAGLRIVVSHNALQDTTERLFPTSKNRSRRIHKKLVKRFGGEFRKQPAIFRTPTAIIMHPAMYAQYQIEMEGIASEIVAS